MSNIDATLDDVLGPEEKPRFDWDMEVEMPFPVLCARCRNPLRFEWHGNSQMRRYVHPKPACGGIRFTERSFYLAQAAIEAIREHHRFRAVPLKQLLTEEVAGAYVYGTGFESNIRTVLKDK
jgi:hypothetical protein